MHVTTLFLWFILYSILGWAYETIYCSIKSLKWDNRGILMGPYCPIYGVGAVLDVLLCGGLGSGWAVFFACMAGSAVLEYVTSYGMERMFHAVWWDYSHLPLNLHGRICLPCSVGFGVAGLIVLYGIQPYMARITIWMPQNLQELAALLFMAVFATDCALTADSLMQLNVKLEATVQAIDAQISEKYDAWIENSKQNISEGLSALKDKGSLQNLSEGLSALKDKGSLQNLSEGLSALRDKNALPNLSEGLSALKDKISMEEFREHRTKEEVRKTISSLSWLQTRVLKSSISFRSPAYHEIGTRIKKGLPFRKKKEDKKSQKRRTRLK